MRGPHEPQGPSSTLLDVDGQALPAAPREGLRLEVQWATDSCLTDEHHVSRVNSRSFYVYSGQQRTRRHLLSQWTAWLQERLAEGTLRVIGRPKEPRLRVVGGAQSGRRVIT